MEYRPYYLAREWVKLGYSVTIVAASQAHVRTVQPKTYEDVQEEMIDGIRYLWLATPGYSGNGVMRVRNMLTFVRRLFMMSGEFAQLICPDLVIASSTYPLDIYPARRVADKAGARLVFEVHDLWPLSPMELGKMSRWHPFIMIMQCAENYAYRRADKVVSMLPKAKEHMCEHGMAPEKFVHIPNGIYKEEWRGERKPLPEEHEALLSRLKMENRFLVGYAGGHAVSNALDQLIDAALLLQNSSVAFLLIGQGVEKRTLEERAKILGLNNLYFLPAVDKSVVPTVLEAMDLLYLGWSRNPLYRFGICPNKLMDYMMAAKPVIHAVDAGNDVVVESGCGISVEPENAAAIADAVTRLKSMSATERERLGKAGKDYVLTHHDYEILAKDFIRSIEAA